MSVVPVRSRAAVVVGVMGLVALSPLAGRQAAAQQDFSAVQIKATHVGGNVYMLEGSGGNIGVSTGPDGTLIVDDQFAPLADKIRAALQEIGKSADQAQLKFVLNTHWHGDHTGGNVEFGAEAPIIAHDNVRKRLSTPQEIMGNVTEPLPDEGLPVITFAESVSIHFNGEEIKAIYLPNGHTDGDAMIMFTGSNVVHMGDDFFTGRFPFVDLNAGGNAMGLVHNIQKALEVIPADATLIPGHGPVSTVEDLKAYHHMLMETIHYVMDKKNAGATVEEIQAEGLPSEWDEWGTGFINADRWIGIIYQSLAQGGMEHQHEDGLHEHDGGH